MRAEIGLRRGGARGAHRGELGAVAGDGLVGGMQMREQRAGNLGAAAVLGEAEEGPGALAEALDQPGFGQQLEMPRDARLRLAQDVGEVGDGELGLGEQRQQPQAGVLAGGFQGGVEGLKTELVGIIHDGALGHRRGRFGPRPIT